MFRAKQKTPLKANYHVDNNAWDIYVDWSNRCSQSLVNVSTMVDCAPYHPCNQDISAVSESRLSNPSPSHHLWVRVITSKSESESSPQSQSQSQSPRVRVQKKNRVRVTNLVVHIFNICLSSKTWKQTTKCIECQSKQRNTARPLLLGLGRDSGPSHESRFLSPSPSPKSEKKMDSSPSPSKMDSSPDSSPSPYSSHTALQDIWKSAWVIRSS